jgi:hypothetical protein
VSASDPRAVFWLCLDCHFSHHQRSRTLPASVLSEANIEFIAECYPTWWRDYIARYYLA